MSGHSMGSKIDTLSDKWGTCVFTMMKKRMKNIITRDNNNNKIKQIFKTLKSDFKYKNIKFPEIMDKLVTEGISVEMKVTPSGGR
uniref:Uncharacterized protein n=1 Tax=Helianthus annuus TaxID=4232 RepID=A0A251VNI8_HELAN